MIITLSNTGNASAIKHSNGLVLQTDKFVQIVANNSIENSDLT